MEPTSLNILVIDQDTNQMQSYAAIARNLGNNNQIQSVPDYDAAGRVVLKTDFDLIIAVQNNSAVINEIDLYNGLRRQGKLTPFIYITDKPESFDEGGEEQAAIDAAFSKDERFVRMTNKGSITDKLSVLKVAVGSLISKPSQPEEPTFEG